MGKTRPNQTKYPQRKETHHYYYFQQPLLSEFGSSKRSSRERRRRRQMAGARSTAMINGGGLSPSSRFSGRPIPKRGQVKVGIAVVLAHSFASIFSLSRRSCAGGHFSQQTPRALFFMRISERVKETLFFFLDDGMRERF